MSGYIAPQQPIQPQPPLQPVYQEEKGLTVCGIVGVVFGALGFVLSFIPIINNIAAIFGFIGVILAIVALVGTFRGKKRGRHWRLSLRCCRCWPSSLLWPCSPQQARP